MKFEYLLFNFVILVGPVSLMLLHKDMKFPRWKTYFKSVIPISLPFIIWDQMVTDFFWSFNKTYILGLFLGKLPIEEIMFFFTVPYACLVLWVNIKKYSHIKYIVPTKIRTIVFILLFTLGIYFVASELWYTALVMFLFGITLIFLNSFLCSKRGLIIFFSVLLLTFIFNLYLTARPVVIYNPHLKTNFNVFSIPLEDFIYGITLILPIIYLYEEKSLQV